MLVNLTANSFKKYLFEEFNCKNVLSNSAMISIFFAFRLKLCVAKFQEKIKEVLTKMGLFF